MPDYLGIFIFVVFFASTIGVVFWFGQINGKRLETNLTELAQRTGLTLQLTRFMKMVSGGSLQGTMQGRAVRFWHYHTGSGKSRKQWCAVGVRPRRATALTFSLTREGAVSTLKSLFGAKEVVTGDTAFDKAWFVESNQPDFLRAALVPEIRAKLTAAHHDGRSSGQFRFADGEVKYAEVGGFASADQTLRLEKQLSLLQDLADVAEVSAGG